MKSQLRHLPGQGSDRFRKQSELEVNLSKKFLECKDSVHRSLCGEYVTSLLTLPLLVMYVCSVLRVYLQSLYRLHRHQKCARINARLDDEY